MNKHYLLDTNIISYLADPNSPYKEKIKAHFNTLDQNDTVSVSIITLYELSYGLHSFKPTNKEDLKIFKTGIDFIKSYLDIIPLDINEVDIFGNLKSKYKDETGINHKSNKKNDLDFLISATAINHNAILVSNDRIFQNLSKIDSRLKHENWLD